MCTVASKALISLNWTRRVEEENNKGSSSAGIVGGAAEDILMTATVQLSSKDGNLNTMKWRKRTPSRFKRSCINQSDFCKLLF